MNEGSGFNEIINNLNKKRKPDQELLSWQNSLELASELLEKYKDQINENRGQDVDGFDNGEVYSDFQKSIVHYLAYLPDEIKEHYYGHGITRGNELEKLAAFISVAKNKLIKGEYSILKSHGYGDVFIHRADFFILSKKDIRLDVGIKNESTGQDKPEFVNIDGEYSGWKVDAGAFIVDTKFYPLVEELKKICPDANIIKANEIPKYLASQE